MTAQLTGLGPFHLTEVLGEGEHATVYLATREGESQPVAVKAWHAAILKDPEALEAAKTRVGVADSITHTAVPRILETSLEESNPYLAMEYIPGHALDALVGESRPSEKAAIAIVHGILEVLGTLAGAETPIVHGRFDAASVMIQPTGRVVLTGFGMHGEPATDLPALVSLIQGLRKRWNTEVDGWLDSIQGDEESTATIMAAADTFPIALEPGHTKALVRWVKRLTTPKPAPEEHEAKPHVTEPSTEKSEPPRPRPRRQQPSVDREDLSHTVQQARWVALACGSVCFLALLIEIF